MEDQQKRCQQDPATAGDDSNSQLWQQCADWLIRLSVLPANHVMGSTGSGVQDLAYTLRDGVVLCHVALALDPNALDIRSVNQRPQSAQFLCLKNIRIFLQSCADYFGLKETDLFQPKMLYEYSEFVRVLHTLSKLSHCQVVRDGRPDLAGFPPRPRFPSGFASSDGAPSLEDGAKLQPYEEEIYKTLEDVTNEDKYQEFYYQHHGSAYGYSGGAGTTRSSNHSLSNKDASFSNIIEEDIYEDLCSFKEGQGSHGDGINSSLPLPHLAKPKEKRDFCIKELIETEANYVDVLNMLKKNFIMPLSAMKDKDKAIVFAHVRDLSDLHSTFYNRMLDAVQKKPSCLGDVFVDFKHRFLVYGDFCSNLPHAQETLLNIMAKDQSFAEEISRCEVNANGGRFHLRDLLAVPMQRVLKYHLLLKQLMTNTPMDHDEFGGIERAYKAMVDVSEYINESKRDSELLTIIRDVQHSITEWNSNVGPPGSELRDIGGRLRKDGELKVQSHEVNPKTKVRYVFVFDRLMLMCKPSKGDHYVFKDSLRIADYHVQDVPVVTPTASGTTTGRGRNRDSMRWAHSFLLVDSAAQNVYTLYTRTHEDKEDWKRAINKAIENVTPPERGLTDHTLAMSNSEPGATCCACGRLMKGLFYQGYQCSVCKLYAHRACIADMPKCGAAPQPHHSDSKNNDTRNRIVPPDLPTRPVSMLVPAATTTICSDDQLLQRQRSTRSLVVTSSGGVTNQQIIETVPAGCGLSSPGNGLGSQQPVPEYINCNRMEDHNWYVGDMDRSRANTKLMDYPVNTFLVRARLGQDGTRLGHAISLRTDTDVKHMKICVEKHEDATTWYYLSESRPFRSVVDLVTYFSRNSLKESFSRLDAVLCLRFPVGELLLVVAKYEFSPALSDKNMLELKSGDKMVVLDKVSGNNQGWWKAIKDNKVGYIPKDFVQPVDNGDVEP